MKRVLRPHPRPRWLPSPAMAVAVLALCLAAGGVAVASIPSTGGVIHGCYENSTGALRVSDPQDGVPRACSPSSETSLPWVESGAPGPRGLPGPVGPAGPAGAGVADVEDQWTARQNRRVRRGAGFVKLAAVHGQLEPCVFVSWTVEVKNSQRLKSRGAGLARAAQIDPGNRSIVTLRLVLDGKPDAHAFTSTVGPDSTETLDGGLELHVPAGSHTLELQASVKGEAIRIGDGSLRGMIVDGGIPQDVIG